MVTITFDDDSFTIMEYVPLGLNDKTSFYPLEKQTIHFHDNGYYKIDRKFLFQPPEFNRKMLFHIYNSNISLLNKLQKGHCVNRTRTERFGKLAFDFYDLLPQRI